MEFPGFSEHVVAFFLRPQSPRTDATEVTVAPRPIVERFDVFRDIGVCSFAILVDSLLDEFFLQAAEE
jgi:hypothetical protein